MLKNLENVRQNAKNGEYYIVDDYGKKYNIIPDNTDCITELVRNKRKYSDEDKAKYSVRYNVLG